MRKQDLHRVLVEFPETESKTAWNMLDDRLKNKWGSAEIYVTKTGDMAIFFEDDSYVKIEYSWDQKPKLAQEPKQWRVPANQLRQGEIQ